MLCPSIALHYYPLKPQANNIKLLGAFGKRYEASSKSLLESQSIDDGPGGALLNK